MNAMMTHKKHYFSRFLLVSFVLFQSIACTYVPYRQARDVSLCVADNCFVMGSFDEIGVENKLGFDANEAGDKATAYKIWKSLAEKGDAGAQNNHGHMYLGGAEGVVPRDYGEAMEWYRKAAKQYHASAHFSIGMLYLTGFGFTTTRDDEEGFVWIRKSAEQGYEYAQYYLGTAYASGWDEVIPKDEAEAIKWMQKAAAQGNHDAQDYLMRKSK